MTRGYITIATGNKHYYKIAANLLKSYRYNTKEPMPFAIIAEEENEFTEPFDDVIITDESTHSFMDKFLLLKLCPYDETIFFDADSLAYGDLNRFWDFFEGATDFSTIGINKEKYDPEGTWYNVEDIWKYGDLIEYKCRVHAGVMFFRNTDLLKKIYDDCVDILKNYDKLYFHTCANSRDEATFGIAMPMNNMRAIREDPNIFGCYPCLTYLKTNMIKGQLSFTTEWDGYTKNSVLLHFGTFHTHEPLYRFDVNCLDYLIEIGHKSKYPTPLKKLAYEKRMKYYCIKIPYEIGYFIKRVYKKITKTAKQIMKQK